MKKWKSLVLKFYEKCSGLTVQWASQVAQIINCLPAMQETQGRSPGKGNYNPLQYSCLENSIDGGAGRLQSMGSQRVGHD